MIHNIRTIAEGGGWATLETLKLEERKAFLKGEGSYCNYGLIANIYGIRRIFVLSVNVNIINFIFLSI